MGRIAEALKRAELDRGEPRLGLDKMSASSSGRSWSGWYGAAASVDAEVGVDAGGLSSVEELSDSIVEGMSADVVVYYDPTSPVSEQHRSLRTRLMSANPRHEHRLWCVSSAESAEGKSVTTLNLGFSFAEVRHHKVLVVDANLRRSALAGLLNIEPEPGLAEFLQGRIAYEDMIRATPRRNLFCVPAGRVSSQSAAELLSSRAARAVFKRIEKDFHYAFVDTPAASTMADTEIIAQWTHGVIWVVRAGRTIESTAKRAVKQLASNNIPFVGGVLVGMEGSATESGSPSRHPGG
ncbi:MAG: CpsD/CapB family tyrosine-protein kinase [Planctomycetes bacterium]|nr:CpsD/CapB family tyrosine-protein kinase [Planctomycetota bacterium]